MKICLTDHESIGPFVFAEKKEREMRAAKKNLVHNIGTTINSFLFMRKNVN